jgi:hypothetical protein
MGEKILQKLKEISQEKWEYHNPHFLEELTELIEDYYDIRDEDVDQWITEMFTA